jgi:hypothetical protein
MDTERPPAPSPTVTRARFPGADGRAGRPPSGSVGWVSDEATISEGDADGTVPADHTADDPTGTPAVTGTAGAIDPGRPSLDLDRIERDLAGVETALARLDDGTYWCDEVTGRPIPDDVLAADPVARRAG